VGIARLSGADVLAALAACTVGPTRDDTVEAKLVTLETSSWVAWKARDGRFFEGFLSDDHLEVGAQGVSGKAAVVGFVASPARVTSMYVNRGGRWLNVLYQQTPIGGK
jgi:hypothetical protein